MRRLSAQVSTFSILFHLDMMIAIEANSVSRFHRCVPGSRSRIAPRRTVGQRPLSVAQAGSNEARMNEERREYKAWGMRVIESNETLPGPENEKDFWDGEQFGKLGEVMEKFFLPGLVVLGLVCGSIAAQTYNQGADTFMTTASPDALPRMVPADLVVAPPGVGAE